jgi:hypothetical protein
LQLADQPYALCQVFGFCGRRSLGAVAAQADAAERNYRQIGPKNFPYASRFEIHISMTQYGGTSMHYGKNREDTVWGLVS